ncbi:peroxidase [Meridianimarinicoccus roseus]|uniref:Peroxidase n=1 Tax=Meridianimarinicoccus roseus TaxID=2072018 RepID=A0A2V2LFE8_9RHOB|nr:peroxidase [Meridianimarinicoccus roseus]PWR04358.1 peroxidase [Meridianimarinicoccus roseus]
MTRQLNLDDIQGNITRAYGRFSFPFARYFFLNIRETEAGRRFVDQVRPHVTTAARWSPDSAPKVTLNIGFTYPGMRKLGLPTRTLQGMPESFVDGMKARAFILGDRSADRVEEDDDGWCAHWDPIWRKNRSSPEDRPDDVHIWISMNARLAKLGTDLPVPELDERTDWLRGLCSEDGVQVLKGHGRDENADFQAASAVFTTIDGVKYPTPREHFGLTDGIGDPVFEGQYPPEQEKEAVIGRGKWMGRKTGWQPIAAGEFILGYPDEAQELPPAAMPPNVMQNGSFMVYRKLHENVATFEAVIEAEAEGFARTMGVSAAQARETVKAKMVGRWSDGVPVATAPGFDDWLAVRRAHGLDDEDPGKALAAQRAYLKSTAASDFRYADDMGGFKCPGGAHLRRVNTRDYLDPLNQPGKANRDATTQLNKRRRILRRGLPYGPDDTAHKDDDTEQGVAMMIIGASIFRQFEFVQQQWIQYGLDFNQGNNTCPLLGDHSRHTRFTIPSDPKSGKPPYVMGGLKTFVETRGGDYFFLPSMTALHMIALGIVDPT